MKLNPLKYHYYVNILIFPFITDTTRKIDNNVTIKFFLYIFLFGSIIVVGKMFNG